MKKILYPGSFDPITYGHMNIIEQSCKLFDEVIVAVMKNPVKNGMFSVEERIALIEEIYKDNPKVKVVTSTGATIDVAIANDCRAIVRGLRTVSDFEYEIQMSNVNKKISNNQVNTICLFAENNYENISSSLVKEILFLDKDISTFVHPIVEKAMQQKKATL